MSELVPVQRRNEVRQAWQQRGVDAITEGHTEAGKLMNDFAQLMNQQGLLYSEMNDAVRWMIKEIYRIKDE
jgi:hypothetical protein